MNLYAVSVIVPCYNEEQVIKETHQRIVGVMDSLACKYQLLYVDDGSRDKTLQILNSFLAQNQNMICHLFSLRTGPQLKSLKKALR